MKVEFGVYVDEVVVDERKETNLKSFENVHVSGSAEEDAASGDDRFQ